MSRIAMLEGYGDLGWPAPKPFRYVRENKTGRPLAYWQKRLASCDVKCSRRRKGKYHPCVSKCMRPPKRKK